MMMLNEGRTSEQRVSVVLLQDATDARDVLDGKLEHDQLHRRLAHDVEVLEETAPHAHDSSTSVPGTVEPNSVNCNHRFSQQLAKTALYDQHV